MQRCCLFAFFLGSILCVTAFNETACKLPVVRRIGRQIRPCLPHYRWFYDEIDEECIYILDPVCMTQIGFDREEQCYRTCKEKLLDLQPPQNLSVFALSDQAIVTWYPPTVYTLHIPHTSSNTSDCDPTVLYYDPDTGYPVNCSTNGTLMGTGNTTQANVAMLVDGKDFNETLYQGKTRVPFHLAKLTEFVVELKSSEGNSLRNISVNGSTFIVTVQELKPNTQYNVLVKAVYLSNSSIPTPEVQLTTMEDPSLSARCYCDSFGTVGGPVKCNTSADTYCQCKPNHGGLFCELCAYGYYRTAPSLPCHKCPCDSVSSTGSCFFDEGYLRCLTCKEGYIGNLCHRCANGYYRNFSKNYHDCVKCEGCHDVKYGLICDPFSGHCRNCQYNTTGDNCEKCVDGYEGDPRKNVPCTPKAMKANHFTPPRSGVIAAVIVGTIVLLSGVVGFIVYKRRHNFPPNKPFWTIEFKEDHEDVNFSAVPEDELERQADLQFYEEQERTKNKKLPPYAQLQEDY